MANRRESIAGAKMETNSFFVNVCAISFPKSPAGICFATAAHSSLLYASLNNDSTLKLSISAIRDDALGP